MAQSLNIAVAMSGGVDSSTVAALLRSQGHNVVGLTMQLWNQRRLAGREGMPEAVQGRCCSLDDVYDARRVAETIGVPYYVVNHQQRFEEDVVRPFVREYLSGRAPIDTARNTRAKPAGTAIQPAHRAAGIMRRKNCRSRDLGRGSAGGGGASPCHSHKPASLMSVLISAVDGDVGASPVTIGATLYAWPINSRGSACMDHNPLFVVAPISCAPSVRRRRTASAQHRFRSCHIEETLFWRGASACETIMVSK